jgi:hypothetical protein
MNTESIEIKPRDCSYRTDDQRTQFDWTLKPGEKGWELQVQPDSVGSCTSFSELAKAYPDDPVVQSICRVAPEWSGNRMHAGTVHHEKAGCSVHVDVKTLAVEYMTEAQKAAVLRVVPKEIQKARRGYIADWCGPAAKAGEWSALLSFLNGLKTLPVKLADQRVTDWLKVLFRNGGPDGGTELRTDRFSKNWKSFVLKQGGQKVPSEVMWCYHTYYKHLLQRAEELFPVRLVDQVYEHCMGYPCPVTGVLYGHAWYHWELPEDVIREVMGWPETPRLPNLRENLTQLILKAAGITFKAEVADYDPPPWASEPGQKFGRHYKVWFTRDPEVTIPVEFHRELESDFWNSVAAGATPPTVEDVLRCLVSDQSYADYSFEDWCREFRENPDSRKAYAAWERCREFGETFRTFFTVKESEELQEILQGL